jgi:hypothetical protein
VVVGVAVAAVIVVGVGPPGYLLPRATVCELGKEIGTYTIWTPNLIANIADGGNVTTDQNEWNLTMTSGSLVTNALRPVGGAVGYGEAGKGLTNGLELSYGDFNWTFYATKNVSEVGTAGGPCTQPYIAEIAIPGGACGATLSLPLSDNSSDASEPHVWNGTGTINGSETYPGCPKQTPETYVWFDSTFHSGSTGTAASVRWDLCNASGYHQLVLEGPAQVPIVVVVPFEGRDISAWGLLTWNDNPRVKPYLGPTATWLVPAGWIWNLASVGPAAFAINPDLPLPGLVAFVRSAC